MLGAISGCSSYRDAKGDPADYQCLAEKGCPASQAPPACPPDVVANAMTFERALRTHAAAPTQDNAWVYGKLVAVSNVCTQKGCSDGLCCNRCDATLGFATAAGTADGISPRKPLTISITDAAFAGYGDESATCAPFPLQAPMIARMAISSSGDYTTSTYGPTFITARADDLCVIANPEETRLAKYALPSSSDLPWLDAPLVLPPPTERCDDHSMFANATNEALLMALRQDSPQLGTLARSEVGCLGREILRRRSLAPGLYEAVTQDLGVLSQRAPGRTERAVTVSEAATFLLMHLCQQQSRNGFMSAFFMDAEERQATAALAVSACQHAPR